MNMRTGLKVVITGLLLSGFSGTSLMAESFEYKSQKCYKDWAGINANCAVFGKNYCRKAILASYTMMKHNCSSTRPGLWKEYKKYHYNITVKGY